MSAASQATERIVGEGVLATRGRFMGNALPKLARAIVAAGVPAIELTLNSHDALNGIEETAKLCWGRVGHASLPPLLKRQDP